MLPWVTYVSRWLLAIVFGLLFLAFAVSAARGLIRFRFVLVAFLFQAAMLVAVPEQAP